MNYFMFLILLFSCFKGHKSSTEKRFKCQDVFAFFSSEHINQDIVEGICPYSCLANLSGIVYGTGKYAPYSAICLSALHDNRVSISIVKDQKVSFTNRTFANPTLYSGMYRNSISSKSVVLAAVYEFVSPRVSDKVLDITSLHRNYLMEEGSKSEMACYTSSDASGESLIIKDYTVDNNGASLSRSFRIPSHRGIGSDFIFNIKLRQNSKPGGYICTTSSSPISNIMSIAMSDNADFLPNILTKTVNSGDDVTISMNSKEKTSKNPTWLINQDILYNLTDADQTELEVKNAQIYKSGLYSLGYRNLTGLPKLGIVRLIVRVCPNQKYGPRCQFNCPLCRNGGVCHDLNGQCICPPGFQGEICSDACGDNRIGRFCSGKCSTSIPGNEETCKGLSICLPDPYGCSCGTGFKGLDCNTPCDDGEYGASCLRKRICHCSDGMGCNRFTGECQSKECADGWIRKPFCDVEKLIDITSLHRNFILKKGEKHQQTCYVHQEDKGVNFREYPGNRVAQVDLPVFRPNPTKTKYVLIYEMNWNDSGFDGGYICSLDGNQISTITSMIAYSDTNIVPKELTKTVSVGDNVTLEMDIGDYDNEKMAWHYNEKKLISYGSKLNLKNVKIEDTGLYSLNSWTANNHQHGIIRLIVRKCKDGFYGNECDMECHKCENGGVCHDVSGVCICAPGFMGKSCEIGCGHNLIGASCQGTCSDKLSDNFQTCEGVLICLPDPFGCTCASGFRGLNCSLECEPGTYGAGCKQTRDCHCESTKHCNFATGHCGHRTCESGWVRRPYCDTTSPVLLNPPEIVNITNDKAIVQWNYWNQENGDLGMGKVAAYIVKLKKSNASEWITVVDKLINDRDHFKYPLESLEPFTEYEVKVLILDDTDSVQENASIATFKTKCSDPVPRNLQVKESTKGKILLTWQFPEPESWKCDQWSGEFKIRAVSTSDTIQISTNKTQVAFETRPYKLWFLCVTGSSFDDASKFVNITYISQQDRPGVVTNTKVEALSSTSFNISWEEPEERNGIIVGYRVDYKQLRWINDCDRGLDYNTYYFNTTDKFFVANDVKPFSQFRIRIRARTIKLGEKVVHTVQTSAAVPSAAPKELRQDSDGWKKWMIILHWQPIKCDESNGDSVKYIVYYWSVDDWDKRNLTANTTKSTIVLLDMIPHTEYQVTVKAANKFGEGIPFVSIRAFTASSIPPVPTSLLAYETSENSISLSWNPPYPPYGIIEYYEIQYGDETIKVVDEKSRCPQKRIREVTIRCLVLKNLPPRVHYKIRISAKNKEIAALSPYSPYIIARTDEGVPGAPEDLKVVNKSMYSLMMAWREPLNTNGKLLYYNITLLDSKGSLFRNKMIEAEKDTNLEFDGLQAASYYEVIVSANTSKGFGPSIRSIVATDNGEPMMTEELKIISKTMSTVTIRFNKASSINGPISEYYLMVFKGDVANNVGVYEVKIENFTASTNHRRDYYTVAKFLAIDVTSSINFVIGNGQSTNGFENPALRIGTKYKFGLIVVGEFNGTKKVALMKTGDFITVLSKDDLKLSDLSISLIALLILFIILITVFAVYLYQRKNGLQLRIPSSGLKLRAAKNKHTISRDSLLHSAMALDIIDSQMNEMQISFTSKVSVEKFPEYLNKCLKDGTILEDFHKLSIEPLKPDEIAKLPQNRTKNRYKVLLPYDETRVILNKIDGDDHSDYINASYISGWNKQPKVYIASQGPKKATFYDFWRMIWNENSRIIIMLTNLVEHGKVKCDKYWPGDSTKYNDINVKFVGIKVQAEYVIRKFQVSRDGPPRIIRQFHFNEWPDHSAPMYTTTVVSMLKEVEKVNSTEYGPMVFHCSAGVGRTGTIIMLDAMLKMARHSNEIDFLNFLHQIRNERVHMIQNEVQYIFAHTALLEALYGVGTSIPCDQFTEEYEMMQKITSKSDKNHLSLQFENINKLVGSFQNEDFGSAVLPENLSKNRFNDILPFERCRPFLTTSNDGTGYINAAFVNGYKKKDAFVLTQFPLPNTVQDFWVCVYEISTHSIVVLNEFPENDDTCKQYWSKKCWICGRISVEMIAEEEENSCYIRTFMICNTTKASEKPRQVKMFLFKNWKKDEEFPSSAYNLIEYMEEIDRWQQQTGNEIIVIQCFDGAKACGLFAAAKFLFDKIREEQIVDVFLSVRNVRNNRPQCIRNQEQYKFLYSLANEYLEGFQTYANFK